MAVLKGKLVILRSLDTCFQAFSISDFILQEENVDMSKKIKMLHKLAYWTPDGPVIGFAHFHFFLFCPVLLKFSN